MGVAHVKVSVKSRRVVLLLAALSLAASATPSLAGPSRACMLVRDAAGDASDQPNLTVPAVNFPDLDILSADIATDARSITTVIRVQDLGTALDAAGRRNQYRFSFKFGQNFGEIVTYAYRGLDGEQFLVSIPSENGSVTVDQLPAKGVFDVARNEVRVTIPIAQANDSRPVRRGTYLSGLTATTFRGVGILPGIGAATGMDSATSESRYLVGTPSCVQVGR